MIKHSLVTFEKDDKNVNALLNVLISLKKLPTYRLDPQYIWLETWEPERMFDEEGIPYHPGAVKFFKEVDVLREKVEQNQK